MCLVVVSWRTEPGLLLNCAGNRDEYYERPSKNLHWWPNGILAGKDMLAQGTWMGVNRRGRFAVVTNYRDPDLPATAKRSRGLLVSEFLTGNSSIDEFGAVLLETADEYAGFNLLYSTMEELHYFSNIQKQVIRLKPGIYGVSNHLLDTPWPKVESAKNRIAAAGFKKSETMRVLRDPDVPDGKLPDTKIGLDLERSLAPIFVTTREYGTRASSFLQIAETGEIDFFERTFTRDGQQLHDTQHIYPDSMP